MQYKNGFYCAVIEGAEVCRKK